MSYPDKSNIRVFLIDDEKAILTSCSQTLRLSGYETETFECAHNALKMLERDMPVVIISDIRILSYVSYYCFVLLFVVLLVLFSLVVIFVCVFLCVFFLGVFVGLL